MITARSEFLGCTDEDVLILFRRAVFAWLIADGDMHMKNLALLKIAEAGAGQFREVRMAPVYDAVTTRVFPRLENDRMALKLNGKDNNLRKADFRKLAATVGMKAGDADEILADMRARLAQGVDQLRRASATRISCVALSTCIWCSIIGL